ncbi:MAG: GDP-mannose 4,6 dehydratase [Anaerolineae bacterium]|nr:GDP-mannose 4,6-dehydratase [Anaerolineales bacterium]MCQ3976364.1 GDP-mannose 4,6 dehydratase [Anaerolineae bacterium]
MRALITGITGFAGGHLAQTLLDRGDEVLGMARDAGQGLTHLSREIKPVIVDLRDPLAVDTLLRETQPDAIYHLAGQAFVPLAWADPWMTLENNIRPQLNILEAMVRQKSGARLLIVASNEVYGRVRADELPVKEDTPLRPNNPYGVSKVAQDILGLQYFLSHGVDVIRVRAFNHIGPRQSPVFVAASFAKQLAEIEAGLVEPVLRVGNLEAKRDFTDVRDVMRAYALLVQYADPGEAYNIGAGEAHSIQSLLDILLSYTNVKVKVEPDPTRMRPSDVPVIYADNSKLRTKTGWTPTCKFEDSLRQVLDYWREEVKSRVTG